ncbi:MAG: peptidoglycan-binding protein [Clostridiales bacterium]|nr:peptidoglycan-binding protein [Clostridiales bacterium]
METLRYGGRGNQVLLLQLALKRAGFYHETPDGVFGTKTLNMLKRFQRASGLSPDGIAGNRTWAAAEPYIYGYVGAKLRQGDTFYRLAKRYGTDADAIAAANPSLDPADLRLGANAVVPLGFPVTATDVPWSSLLAKITAEGLMKRYPFISTELMGYSVLGRELFALKMGKGKREVFINAAHHANEWITAPLVFDFLETCAEAYASGGEVEGRSAASLFSETKLFITPMVDPDGVDLVNGAAPREGYERARAIAEDYPDIPFPSGWKANIEGTDLNLNYPAEWDTARDNKYRMGYVKPAPRDFVGGYPLSAPESAAVYGFTKRHDFALTVSYHTQGGEIYWQFAGIEPEGGEALARKMAEVSGYKAAEAPYESGFAGYKDWFILEYRRPGFTVEAGRGSNPLPLSQYGSIRRENFPIMAAALAGE